MDKVWGNLMFFEPGVRNLPFDGELEVPDDGSPAPNCDSPVPMLRRSTRQRRPPTVTGNGRFNREHLPFCLFSFVGEIVRNLPFALAPLERRFVLDDAALIKS